MRKLLHIYLTILLLAFGLPAMADKIITFDLSSGYEDTQTVETVEQGGITLTFAKGTHPNSRPKYYDNGEAVRCYYGNTLTISSNNLNITSITFSFNSNNSFKSSNCIVNTGSLETGNPSIWKGEAKEVVFTNSSTSDKKEVWYIQTIKVTLADPPLPEVNGISALRALEDGTQVRLVLTEENAGNIEWVDTNDGTYAYVRDNDKAVRFSNFLPEDAGWHTSAGGALIGAVDGEYHINNGMPEFIHIATSIADSILCLDHWQTCKPTTVSDLSELAGTDYRADYVAVEGVSLTTDDGEHYDMVSGDTRIAMTNKFGLSDLIPEDITDQEFNIEGILGTNEDGSASELYCTHIKEVLPNLALSETLKSNTATIGNYNGREVNITVERHLVTNMWNTICLPFDIYEFSDIVGTAKLAEFTGYDATNNTLEFSSVDDLKAGHPYLIYPTEDMTVIHIKGTNISSEMTPVTYGIYEMVGIYDPTTLYEGDRQVMFLGNNNILYHPNVTNDLKAFRAYFRTASETSANICIDGIVSDIRTATIDEIESDQRIYNVSGQLMGTSSRGLQKGIYVSNGNKVVIK